MKKRLRIIEPMTPITVRVPIRLVPKIEHLEGQNRSDKVRRLIEWATSAQTPQSNNGT